MQMLSRDSTRPENNKKSLNKNGNTFCCELLNRTGLGQCVMQSSTKLCLAFFEFFTVLESKINGFFNKTQSPKAIVSHLNAFDFKDLKKAKHRSDILKGLDIMQLVK